MNAVLLLRLCTRVDDISCKAFGSWSNSSDITSTEVDASKMVAMHKNTITMVPLQEEQCFALRESMQYEGNLQRDNGDLNCHYEQPNDKAAKHIGFEHVLSQLTELKIQ